MNIYGILDRRLKTFYYPFQAEEDSQALAIFIEGCAALVDFSKCKDFYLLRYGTFNSVDGTFCLLPKTKRVRVFPFDNSSSDDIVYSTISARAKEVLEYETGC